MKTSKITLMRKVITSISVLLFSAFVSGAAAKPNIVFILADDMPWWGTSVQMEKDNPYSTSKYRVTPNIKTLAEQGMTFSSAHASAGMCAPSRCSIQTGLTPARTLFSGNGNFGSKAPDEVTYKAGKNNAYLIEPSIIGTLRPELLTIGEALKEQGYATAHFGKWHVYGGGPENNGYDASDGETSNDEGRESAPGDPKQVFSITKKAMDFMEKQHKAGKPFYVQLSHYIEHSPQVALPETTQEFEKLDAIKSFPDKKAVRNVVAHGAAVLDLDTTIGMLLDELEKMGIRDNTYIVFTSDNGGKGLHNGEDDILRGEKWTLWEGGTRVPLIIAGPEIKPGSRSSVNTASYDFLPTFYEMAGGDPETIKDSTDGISLLPVLAEKNTGAFEDRALYFHYPHARNFTPSSGIIQGDYKLLFFYETPDKPYLFDLSKDLGEADNLAASMPEKTKALLGDLQSRLSRVGAYLPKENPDADTSKPRFDPDTEFPPVSVKGR